MRTIRSITVAVFLLLCLLPAAQMASHLLPELAVDEQRALAPAPDVSRLLHLPRQANAWFSDHFGLRSTLIRLKGQIDYALFGASERVLIGRDGYLWYRSVIEGQRPGVAPYVAAHRVEIVEGMRRYAVALREAGIGMIVTINLLGDRFLPDKLPAPIAARPVLDAIDGVASDLAALPELHFVDSTAILRRTMAERAIFHRTDFHWNDAAAFPVAEAIVAEISRAEGHAATLWRHPLRIDVRDFSGGVARFMPVLHPPSERGLFVVENWAWPPGMRASTTEAPYEFTVRSGVAPPEVLGPTVLLGDSYMDGMWRSGLGAYFSATYRIRWRPGPSDWTISQVTEALPADTRWLVVQFIEVNFGAMQAFADRADVDRAIALLAARSRAP